MSEQHFNLVFRGEVLEGQHAAVVARRLAALLKMDEQKVQALFTGRSVTLKREVPKAVAAKYQAAFKQAGARLRVTVSEAVVAEAAQTPLASTTLTSVAAEAAAAQAPAKKMSLAERLAAQEAAGDAAPPSVASEAGPAEATDVSGADAFTLAPPGEILLAEAERRRVAAVEVDTSHLSAAAPGVGSLEDVTASLPPPPAPDVSGITLAEIGVDLAPVVEEIVAAIAIPEIDLAAPGSDIETLPAPPPPPVPDAHFAVAELGADLDPEMRPAPPPAPDTSHLKLATERASFASAD